MIITKIKAAFRKATEADEQALNLRVANRASMDGLVSEARAHQLAKVNEQLPWMDPVEIKNISKDWFGPDTALELDADNHFIITLGENSKHDLGYCSQLNQFNMLVHYRTNSNVIIRKKTKVDGQEATVTMSFYNHGDNIYITFTTPDSTEEQMLFDGEVTKGWYKLFDN